ncbi:hypothetical protein F183_A13630 [Bryobacterales bacterium F-183]|nr:hypothetical protein F183_A13630 [Bryobacterales bacterium F-183]
MYAEHLYRALLFLYPGAFRQEYGDQMLYAFSEQIHDERNPLARAVVCLSAACDVLTTAPKEHYYVLKDDLRYAFRTLAAQPMFLAIAVLSLGIGIGANVGIFSLLHAVALNTLPAIQRPDTLVLLTDPAANGVSVGAATGVRHLLTYREFEHLQQQTVGSVFASLMVAQSSADRTPVRINTVSDPEDVRTHMVSAAYFETLGTTPFLGRTFQTGDNPADAHAVVSYDFWQRRLEARPDVVGATIFIRQTPFVIIGITPPSFVGETVGEKPDLWLPLTQQAAVLPGRDWLHDKPGTIEKVMWLQAFARLAPGVSMASAESAVNAAFQRDLESFIGATSVTSEMRKNFLDQRLQLKPGGKGASSVRSQFAEPLTVLLAAAAVVLLIACANLGNLMLTRATARSREIAVRLALGAGRGRVIRQMLTESLVVALLGGVVGIAGAQLFRAGLLRLTSDRLHVPGAVLDPSVLAFAFVLTVAAGLLLALLPAFRVAAVAEAGSGLREQGRGLTTSRTWALAGKMVVVGQVALSLPLLAGAGLLMQTLRNLQNVDVGYARQELLMMRLDLQTAQYADPHLQPLLARLTDRFRAVPGVRAVSYSNAGMFLGSDSSDEIQVEGFTPSGSEDDSGSRYDHIGPGFFSTLGIPIVLGREINASDRAGSKPVCVINEAFAKRFFAGRNPLGLHITQIFGNQRNTYEVVGVAKNSRKRSLRGDIEHRFFVPSAQPIDPARFVTFAVRTVGPPNRVITDLRRAVQAEDPKIPIGTTRSIDDILDERLSQDRLMTRLSIAFGAVALLLAAIGLYGVLSYGVARRTNEIGIRKALGAQNTAVMSLILRETGVLLALGTVAGIALSIALLRLIASRLYGLAPADPMTLTVSVVVLALVAFSAAWLPAARASRVDPLTALRQE